jgi:hypothetical protein
MALPRIAKSTVIAGLLLAPVIYLTARLYGSWSTRRAELNRQSAEFQRLSTRNAELARAYDVLLNRKFQVCNKSAYPVSVQWLSAAYSDGKQLKVFDSARCGWSDLEVAPGENKNLILSSSQEGCNWNGNVMYYAMRFSKETDEASVAYNVAMPYRGFDRDCFTVQ